MCRPIVQIQGIMNYLLNQLHSPEQSVTNRITYMVSPWTVGLSGLFVFCKKPLYICCMKILKPSLLIIAFLCIISAILNPDNSEILQHTKEKLSEKTSNKLALSLALSTVKIDNYFVVKLVKVGEKISSVVFLGMYL